MKFRKSKKVEAAIPTGSMADIAFLLIVFFMVSTTFSQDKTTVNLPATLDRQEIPKNALHISITEDGVLRVGGQEATMEDITPAAMLELQKNKEQWFLIKVDKEVRYGLVEEVLERLRSTNARNICFLTVQEVVE